MDTFSDGLREKNLVTSNKKTTLTSKNSKSNSFFSEFCNQVTSYLSPDNRAEITEKFLNPDIVSVFKDTELVECVNAFFKNNLNLSETSRIAFVHRNTLIYRIEKIAKLTGLNIRNFEDAMSFKILSIVYQNMLGDVGKK